MPPRKITHTSQRANRYRKGDKGSSLFSLLLLLAGFLLLLFALDILLQRRGSKSIRPEVVDKAIDSVLVRFGVDRERVAKFEGVGGLKKERIRISNVYSPFFFQQILGHLLQRSGAQIINGVELNEDKNLLLRIGFGERVTHLLLVERDPLVSPREAKLALILQDFEGGNEALLAKVLRSDIPLTISFLPGTELRELHRVQEMGNEVIVALPFKSSPLRGMRKWEVGADMEPEQIRERLRRILDYFPQVKGVDLSFASPEDQDLLPIILKEITGRYLLANHQIMGDPWEGESMLVFSEEFIDNRGRREYILAKLRKVACLGWMQGEMVGVGRLSPQTWKVIEKEGPKLERKGIRFVPVSELLPREGEK